MALERADLIARKRRQQPISELERKARKAGRRRRGSRDFGFSEEAKDLSFAQSHDWYMQQRTKFIANNGLATAFCHSCCALGRDWDSEAKLYRLPPLHSPGCYFGPTPPEVYAGTTFTGAKAGPVGPLP